MESTVPDNLTIWLVGIALASVSFASRHLAQLKRQHVRNDFVNVAPCATRNCSVAFRDGWPITYVNGRSVDRASVQ